MSELDTTNISAGSIVTPAAGLLATFSGLDKRLKSKDSTGFISSYQTNFSTVAQSGITNSRVYIAGSAIALPAAGALQIGSMFRWRFDLTKTAAGTAAATIDIAFGTAGTTSDTARVSFVLPVGTANADTGFIEIDAICRGPLSASGVVSGNMVINKQSATATLGIINQQSWAKNIISSTFDVTLPTFVGLCITAGASDSDTIQQVQTEAWNV